MTELHYILVDMPWLVLVALLISLIVVSAKSMGDIFDKIRF